MSHGIADGFHGTDARTGEESITVARLLMTCGRPLASIIAANIRQYVLRVKA